MSAGVDDGTGDCAVAAIRAIMTSGGGRFVIRLAGHPAVMAVLEANSGWLEDLAGQMGGAVTLRADASLPINGSYAETP